MGRIHCEPVSLDELLRLTPLVVVARPVSPGVETGSVELGEGLEPYTYPLSHLEAVEWLRPARRAWQGERLLVSGFDADDLSLHVAFHAFDIHKSPFLPSYAPRSPPARGEALLLFLRRGAYLDFDPQTGVLTGRIDTLMPSLAGAVEGLGARDTIATRALHGPRCANRLELVIGAPGYEESMDERIAQAVEASFGHEAGLCWHTVDTRPRRRRL